MELNQCINYLLTTSQHTVFQLMTAKLQPYDITPVQYGVLYCLWELKQCNPKEIAETLRLENSTVSGVLDRMEKKGLIERSLCREDRRCVEIELTKKGRGLRDGVVQAVDEVNQKVLSGFTREEAETLKVYLRAISTA